MDRLSNIITLEDEYMESRHKKSIKNCIQENKSRNCNLFKRSFNLQEKVIKARLIRYIIKRLFGSTASIEKIHIDDVMLCNNNIGNKYLTPNKNVKILVKNHKIYFKKRIISFRSKCAKLYICNKKRYIENY